MTIVRQLIAAGDLRDGDTVVHYCVVHWLRVAGGLISFSASDENSHQLACMPVGMDVWVERDVAVPERDAISPFPTVKVPR